MSDEPVKECEVCGEPVRRLLFPVAIQFKGKGFYTTDYARKSTIGSACSTTANGGGSESSSGRESGTSDGGDAGHGKSDASPSEKSEKKPVTAVASANSD
jgi:predicted nucleic acid-binding Zn ribbon protein